MPATTKVRRIRTGERVGGVVDKVIAERFADVLKKADAAQNTVPRGDRGGIADRVLMTQWRTQSLTLLRSLFPEDHSYVTGFIKGTEKSYFDTLALDAGRGVLLAAQEDFERGYLWSLNERVHADVFDDFLEMAASLVDDGYKDAAAVIAG